MTQGSSTTESYTYDPVGNRLTSLGSAAWSYNISNELTSRPSYSYTYDANGNTQTIVNSSGTTTYAWDFENRLTSVTLPGSGGTVTFKYDPFGRRIYKSSSPGTSIYAYDGDNLIEEANSSGTAVARYAQGLNIDEPLAMLRSGTTSYYQADGLGSLTSLSNTSGALANTYTYDSFGNLVASSGSLVNSFRYTGREFDTETSLYYYRARYYDPQSGRFLSEDPIGFRGGMNFYSYVHNAAIDVADSFGLRNNKCSWLGGCSDIPLPWMRKPCGSGVCKNNTVSSQIRDECHEYNKCVLKELGKGIGEDVEGKSFDGLSQVKPLDPNPTHDGSDPIKVERTGPGLGELLKMGQGALLKALQDCFKQHPMAGLDPGFNAVDVGQESTGPDWFESFVNGVSKLFH